VNCPLCIDRMLVPNHRGGIEIDVCPQCHGIWLDRGELDKLVRPAAERPSASARLMDDRRPVDERAAPGNEKQKKKSKKKKKKSSLGDRLGDILEDVLDL